MVNYWKILAILVPLAIEMNGYYFSLFFRWNTKFLSYMEHMFY